MFYGVITFPKVPSTLELFPFRSRRFPELWQASR
jgi:hypothetical protein